MLDDSGAVNHSGTSVTTLIRSIATRPPPRAGRALLAPGPRLLGVHVDHRWIGFRVVMPDRRDEAPVARRLGVGDDDAEKGLTLPTHPAQSNLGCHSVPYILLMNLLILRICWNCSSSRFTSCTDRPDPFPIRSF